MRRGLKGILEGGNTFDGQHQSAGTLLPNLSRTGTDEIPAG